MCGNSLRPVWFSVLLILAILSPSLAAADERGLFFDAEEGRQKATSLGSSVHLEVTGVVGTATAWQIFQNPTDREIDGAFIFPLPEKIAVDRLEILIGERRIVGEVRERKAAQRIYEQAAAEGRIASVVRKERSNIFSTSVANIPPGEIVEIVVGWQQEVDYRDGTFSLRLPTMLAPRYGPGDSDVSSETRASATGRAVAGGHHVGLLVDLAPGFPIGEIRSPSHVIEVESGRRTHSVVLAEGVVMADRDFELEWRPARSSEPHVGLLSSTRDGVQHLLMLVSPPSERPAGPLVSRELIFVIDTSGSMAGESLVQAKASLVSALGGLASGDRFNVISFDDTATALHPSAVSASPDAVGNATVYVSGLVSGGGTNMLSALRIALSDSGPRDALRQVVFITDGRVEGETLLFEHIARHIGRTRLFTVGIGSAPNSHFLRNAARHGRGEYTYVSATSQVQRRMDHLLKVLSTPLVTDITIEWPDPLAEPLPDPISDLYAGEPLAVTARQMPTEGTIRIRGWHGDELWEHEIELPEGGPRPALPPTAALAIEKLWAARKIEALTDRLVLDGAEPMSIRAEVTELALAYQLLSPYTSLVAVDELAAPRAMAGAGILTRVTDPEGNALPGVTIEISGSGTADVGITDSNGEASFPSLSPGTWQLRASLDGFSVVEYPQVEVRGGRGTMIEIVLSSAVEEVVTVTSASPLLDQRQAGAGTTLSQIELEQIPTARDPWSVLDQALPARPEATANGGAPGSRHGDALAVGGAVRLDGVELAEPDSISGRALLPELVQIARIDVSTGGPDAARFSSGAVVDLLTKRGTNETRGSVHLSTADADAPLFLDQSRPHPEDSQLGAGQSSFTGDSLDGQRHLGAEIGGPAVRDRLWLWGSYGRSGLDARTGAATPDLVQMIDSVNDHAAVKINAQLEDDNSVVASWHEADYEELGHGAGPTRPAPTAGVLAASLTHLRLQDTHVLNSNLFVTGTFQSTETRSSIASRAALALGPEAPQARFGSDGVWSGSHRQGEVDGYSRQWLAEGRYFFNLGRAANELGFGGRLRKNESHSRFTWPSEGARILEVGAPRPLLITQRGLGVPIRRDNESLWAQNTATADRWTLVAGLRHDRQRGSTPDGHATANPWFPTLQPEVEFAGGDTPFDWRTISPRLGLTYALGSERRTLLKTSFARFPERLRAGLVSRLNPVATSYLTLLWTDGDGSGDFNGSTLEGNGPDEVAILGTRGFDLEDPAASISPNRTDPGLDPALTDEVLLGIEHALLPEFLIGANVTWRRVHGIHEQRALVRDASGGVRVNESSDYVLDGFESGTLPGGDVYSVPVFALHPSLDFTGGSWLVNGDRERETRGGGVTLFKRLSRQWMLRSYLHFGETEWLVPAASRRFQSPNLCADSATFGCQGDHGGAIDGGLFAIGTTDPAATDGTWSQHGWQYSLSGMYQAAPGRPWGFNIGAHLFGREGHPLPYFLDVVTSDGQNRDILVRDEIDASRVDDLSTLDLRLDKEFKVARNVSVTAAVEVFNVFNENATLEREPGLSRGSAGDLRSTLRPRIWRFGTKLGWR